MPISKLPVTDLDNINHRRRARETINQVLDHSFDDSRVRTKAEVAAGVTPVNTAYAPGNVLRYGAVGDNVTDCSPAFQAAFDQAAKFGGADVYLPQPETAYLLNAQINGTTNRPIKITGSGWGWTSSGVGGPAGGCIVRLGSAAGANAACFDWADFVMGVHIEGIHFYLNVTGSSHRGIRFQEALQVRITNCRFEGASSASDDQYGIELLDPTAGGGTYTGGMNITGNYFTTVKYGIVCGANITTTRITNNDFSGFTGSVNAIWCKALTVGIRIVCNRIEGFDCGFLDEGVGNDFSHNYLENNTLTQDRTAADLPISIGNTIVSGGAGTFPTDRTTARIQIQPRTFIVDDTAAEFGGGYKEYYRSIRAGDQNAYSVTATGSGTLTYTTITTLLLNYSVFGNTMTVQWFLTGTIGGAGAELRIALPSGVTAVGRRRNLVHNHEAGAYKVGVAEVQNGDAFIRISKDVNISGNWTAGTADTSGSIHFQCSGI